MARLLAGINAFVVPRPVTASRGRVERYDARQMTDEGQEGQDPSRDRRTWPAITDFYCCALASLGAVVAVTVVAVLLFWHAGPSKSTR
jgi:hypothetical protein